MLRIPNKNEKKKLYKSTSECNIRRFIYECMPLFMHQKFYEKKY